MQTRVSDDAAKLIRESAADKRAAINRNSTDKVTCASINIGSETHWVRLTVNAWCSEPALASHGPVETYRRLVGGAATVQEITAILRAGMRGAKKGDDDFKPGPIVDGLLADYPLSVAVAAAEVTLAAWIVGIDPPKEA